jgi:acyl carrier protein
MLNKQEALKLIATALDVGAVDEDSSAVNQPNWDSLGHLNVLTALDQATSGKAAEIEELAEATSVRLILDLLGRHGLLSD